MKQLELNIKKRLLIVEAPEHSDMDCPFEILPNKGFKYLVFSQCKGNIISRYKLPDGDWKFLCKGPDFTEEIAKGLVDNETFYYYDGSEAPRYKNYLHQYEDDLNWASTTNYFELALDAFISAIEANGFFWGYKEQNTDGVKMFGELYQEFIDDLKTFNIDNVKIFEIQ